MAHTKLDRLRRSEAALTFTAFIKWVLLSVFAGLIIGAIGALFNHTLVFVNNLRAAHRWITLGLPLGGLLIVLITKLVTPWVGKD